MTQCKTFLKSTKELTESELGSIIKLKQQHWNYNEASQLAWFQKNIAEDDLHLLIVEQNAPIAYLDAVWVDVQVNDLSMRALGIGNVCVADGYRNHGVGTLLFAEINAYLKKTGVCGFLLCKKELVSFYEKSNWQLLNAKQITVAGKEFPHLAMCYNAEFACHEIEKIAFSRLF